MTTADQIRATVRKAYGAIASHHQPGGCGGGGGGCCGPIGRSSTRLGYSDADIATVPADADLGLGCGNPQAIAALALGERVLDLGSGGGFDAFLAARQVGPTGRVIGVDMTPEMIALARRNTAKTGWGHVDFRLGDIARLPVDDASIDVILSNCVINLTPDKPAVFREAFRVLVPGGRLALSDMVALDDIPAAIAQDPAAYTGCIAGAAPVVEIERMIADAGFERVRVSVQAPGRELVEDWSPGSGAGPFVASALIEAVKPGVTPAVRTPAHKTRMRAVPSPPNPARTPSNGCCDSTTLSTCCAPASKASCCGSSSPPGTCGCQSRTLPKA